MMGFNLHIKFRNNFLNTDRGVLIKNVLIPEHLIREIDHAKQCITLCSGWKLYEHKDSFVISYHKLVIRLDAPLIECIQTRGRL